MTAYLLICLLSVVLALALVETSKPGVPTKTQLIAVSSATHTPPPDCTDSQRAITYYRRAYTTHRQTMRATPAVPRVWYHTCEVVRRRAAQWRERATLARGQAIAWNNYHYNWRQWLPDNWARLGACETGYGRRPGNFRHANSRFVSAFGISRSIYDRDARHAGVPAWNDSQPPTPREQYEAAKGHYALFGDGWTCPGP